MALQQSDQEVPLQEQEEQTFCQLSKQNSILSLTLDEFQCKSGKSFGTLNMDEFLASIWSSNDETTHKNHSKSVVTEHTISQHGNSFSVPSPICKKTVDEVWSEIHKSNKQFKEANNIGRNETLMKQQTLGEMTLEDFLVKAGVVQESSSFKFRTTMPFQNNVSCNRPLNQSLLNGLKPSMGIGFSTDQCVSSNGFATYQISTVEKCRTVPESSGCGNRKRIIDGPPEVVAERRQRRMLKNRESAARSRARRQVLVI